MIIDKIGHIKNNFYYLGTTASPIFLLDGPQPAIFDAGVTCAGKLYVEALRSILGQRQPAWIYLTHVHWDHCGAASYLQKAFPELKIAATAMAKNTLQRPNALSLINRLNQETLERTLSAPGMDPALLNLEPFAPFSVDMELPDEQTIAIGATAVQVLATPGHTQDHHSFYLPHDKILIAGEAAGIFYSHNVVSPEFTSDYDAYLSSLKRLAALPVEILAQGHHCILAGQEETRSFFANSINETVSFKDRVMELLDRENGDLEKVINTIKAERYDAVSSLKQPESTYLINLKAKVAQLAKKRLLQS